MRLTAQIDEASAAIHLCRLYDEGIDTIHSSHEYPTDPILIEAVRAAGKTGRTFRHITKLAEPSYDHHRFDARRLEAAVDQRLVDLGVKQLTCIQWMVRTPTPQDNSSTLEVLEEDRSQILDCLDGLLASGKIGAVALFPYTRAVAEAAIDGGIATTLTVYLNRIEDEYTDLADAGVSILAIRPLAGGSLADDRPSLIADAIRYPLLHPSVATTIVSLNSTAHLEAAVKAAGSVCPDQARFSAIRTAAVDANDP